LVVFDVVILRGQLSSWFEADLGGHLGVFAVYIKKCYDVPFEN
jgi:hypothetical protein